MIKLLYITNSLNTYSETFIRNTIESFQKHNILNITVATLNKQPKFNSSLNINIPSLIQIFTVFLGKIGLSNFSKALKFYFIKYRLRNISFDIVWIDFGDNAINLFSLFNNMGVKVVVHLHGYDASKLLFNREYCTKLSHLSQNNTIIVPSMYNKKRLILAGCKAENIYVVPYAYYGVFSDQYAIIPKRNKPLLLFVGRFVQKKDPRILIYAFKEVIQHNKNVDLYLIGDGILIPEVVLLVKQFGLSENIHLLGSLPQVEVFSWMRSAYIYIQHSVTTKDGDQEGYPNSILEAQCSGLPVVATIHAGIPEIVENGITGYLVQEFDFQFMANRILALLEDSELRDLMGFNALKKFKESANPYNRVEKLVSILQNTLEV